jgi:hypothetical protein
LLIRKAFVLLPFLEPGRGSQATRWFDELFMRQIPCRHHRCVTEVISNDDKLALRPSKEETDTWKWWLNTRENGAMFPSPSTRKGTFGSICWMHFLFIFSQTDESGGSGADLGNVLTKDPSPLFLGNMLVFVDFP